MEAGEYVRRDGEAGGERDQRSIEGRANDHRGPSGFFDADARRVQEEPAQSHAAKTEVERLVAVSLVPGDRMAERRAMHPDLMGAAGPRKRLREGHLVAEGERRELGDRLPAGAGNPHPALASRHPPAIEGKVHSPPPGRQGAADERYVTLVERPPAQGFVQGPEGAPAFGDDEAPGRVPVEPMSELKAGGPGPRRAEKLDHPEGNPASAMGGETRGLVQHQQLVVLVEDFLLQANPPSGRGPPAGIMRFGGGDRRDPYRLSGPQPPARPHPRAVHPHFSPAHQTVQPAAGNVR